MNKRKVIVGMSGGVDSSVAAALLLEQGFEVIGLTITPFKIEDDCKTNDNPKNCCSYQGMGDANKICEILGIEHRLIDLTELFGEVVVDNFTNEYLKGRTPNPCVECNPIIKWGEMLKIADSLDAFYVATGHYADVMNQDGRYFIRKGIDKAKDQSYFLWKLTQEQLARTIFPLGQFEKPEIRKIAEKYSLPVFNKPDSQEICFISGDDYRVFLDKKFKEKNINIAEGKIIFNNEVAGIHKGYPYYTVGQRKGVGVTNAEPLYVKNIDAQTNTIVVTTNDKLQNTGLLAKKLNLMKYDSFQSDKEYLVKVRYRDSGARAICKVDGNGDLIVEFSESRRAITAGQSVVIFEDNDLVAGGIIENVF